MGEELQLADVYALCAALEEILDQGAIVRMVVQAHARSSGLGRAL